MNFSGSSPTLWGPRLGTLLDGVFVKWQITLPTYISMIIASSE